MKSFKSQCQSLFDRLQIIAQYGEPDFYGQVAQQCEIEALALAGCRYGLATDAVGLLTARDGLAIVGKLLAGLDAIGPDGARTGFLTPPEVAKRLSVSPDTVRLWIGSGRLAATNLAEPGKRPRYRISTESLADFDRGGRAVAPATPRRKLATVPFSRY